MDCKDFIRDRLFYKSEIVLTESADRKFFEQMTASILHRLDFTSGRNKILLDAYDFLVQMGADGRCQRLFLSLLDGGMAIVEATEVFRKKVIDQIEEEMLTLGESSDHEDAVDSLETDIHVLQVGTFTEISEILKKYNLDKLKREEATPFEAAFVRGELRNGTRGKSGKPWKRFRDKLILMFGLSKQQISSIKAWESEGLRDKGGKTTDELILEMRQKVQQQAEPIDAKPTAIVESAGLVDQIIYQGFLGSAHFAHVKKLEPATFQLDNGKISREQRRWIFALMILVDDGKRSEVRKILAEQVFHCKPKMIAAVTAYLTGGCRQRASAEIKADIKVSEDYLSSRDDSTPEEPSQKPETSLLVVPAEGCEHFDYDNKIKRAWRTKLKEFIAGNTKIEDRATMRVLCLAGKKCLEIPLYLELGFKPENIVAVEGGDEEAKTTFEQNASRMNIKYRTGDLEELALDEQQTFDVVSLDFPGQICSKYERIIRNILPANKVLVLLNTMAKRESREIQAAMGFFHQLQDHNPEDFFEHLKKKFDSSGNKDLGTLRDTGTLNLVEQIGANRPESRPHRKRVISLAEKINLEVDKHDFLCFSAISLNEFNKNFGNFLETLGLPKQMVEMYIKLAMSMATSALQDCFVICEYAKYEYSSTSKTKFQSDFACLETHQPAIARIGAQIIDFYLDVLEAIFSDAVVSFAPVSKDTKRFTAHYQGNLSFGLETKHGKPVKYPNKKDTIVVRRNHGKVVAKMQLQHLQSELKRCDEFTKTLPFEILQNDIVKMKREKIVLK